MFLRPIIYLFFLLLTNSLRAQTSIGLEGGFSSNSFSTAISNRVSTQIFSGKGFDGTVSSTTPAFFVALYYRNAHAVAKKLLH